MTQLSWLLTNKPLPLLQAQAQRCEEAGLDGVWFADYQGPMDPDSTAPELFVALASLARETRRVTLGSLVTDVLRRHPMILAHAFATLSSLAPGRVILGLGAGGATSHRPFGIAMERVADRLAEGIAVIRLLWRARPEEPADFAGSFFHLSGAVLPIEPAGHIPIVVAAQGPRVLRMAGRHGDGWVAEAHTPETYRAALAAVREAGRAVSRAVPDALVALLYYPFETTASERSDLIRAAKTMLAFNVDIVRRLAPGLVPEGARTTDVAGDPGLWRRIRDGLSDEQALATTLIGDESRCRDRISEYVEAGCRHVVLEPYWRMSDAQLATAIEVAGHLRAMHLIG